MPATDQKVTSWQSEASSFFYQAIKNKNLPALKFLLDNKELVNAPLDTAEIYAGYTPLHIACLESYVDLVNILVNDYGADVNIVAEDGAQPIHLSCLTDDNWGNSTYNVRILLRAHANVEARISKNLFTKYCSGETWGSEFGDSITLLTLSVLYNRDMLADSLIQAKADVNVKTRTNKTLLMYALESSFYLVVDCFRDKIDDEYLSTCDNSGYYHIHYMLHPDKFGGFRYDAWELFNDDFQEDFYIPSSQEIQMTINGNEDTYPLNMAAYRGFSWMLQNILKKSDHIEKSKALYLATLPLGDPEKSYQLDANIHMATEEKWNFLQRKRKETLVLVVADLVNRITFGWPVPQREKVLLKKLMETDEQVKEIVHQHEKKFFDGVLKKEVIQVGDKDVTLYDFILQCANDRKFRRLVRDQEFLNACRKIRFPDEYFIQLFLRKVCRAAERVALLNKLKSVKQLKNAIPLEYECILYIIDYLGNEHLDTFIRSFFND